MDWLGGNGCRFFGCCCGDRVSFLGWDCVGRVSGGFVVGGLGYGCGFFVDV